MTRMPIVDAIARYEAGVRPRDMRKVGKFTDYEKEMKVIMPALIGAMLELDLKSISAPQIGSKLPIMVLRYPVIRILIDPIINTYDKKGQRHVRVLALNYKGDSIVLDTFNEYSDKWDNDAAYYSILTHTALWESIELGVG